MPKSIPFMKRIIKLTIVAIVVVFASCGKNSIVTERMNEIRDIGDENPHLALLMLDSLNTVIRKSSEKVVMKHDLLRLRLQDKAYITATSDIIAKQLISYYEEHGSEAEMQEAYYYGGSVYRDLQDTPRALEFFLQSAEIAEKHSGCDSVMLRNSYSNLCYLYGRVQDFRNQLRLAKMAYSLSKEMGEVPINIITQLGNSYATLDSTEMASKTLAMGLKQIMSDPNRQEDTESLCSLLLEYSYLKDSINAGKCYSLLERQEKRKQGLGKDKARYDTYCAESGINLAYAMYYELTGKSDSAVYCYQRIIDDGTDLFRMYDASKALFHLYNKSGKIAEANKYAEIFTLLSDTIDFGKRQELAATVNNGFQYHLDRKKEQELKDGKERYRNTLIIVSLMSLLLLSLGYTIYVWRKNKHMKEVIALSAELQRINAELSENETALKEKEQLLSKKISQNKAFLDLLHQSELEGKAEDVINAIRKSSVGRKNMKSADWKRLCSAVDQLYPDFKDQLLNELGTFTEQQMRVCYLMKIGLSNTQIQNMTDLSRTTVWRLVKKYSWVR